jgi:capsid assembly protease
MRLIDIVTGPWAIQPEKLREIVTIYETHTRGEKIDIKAVEARIGQPLANDPAAEYEVLDGVAVIRVDGPIAPKANLFTRVSGGASAQMLERQVRDAASDPMVRAIVLDIDSPGGSVQGVPSVAAAVRAAADAKPVVAWSAGTVASGAYWIASAADRIYIGEPTAVLGSIGVVYTHVDVSKAEAKTGTKTTEITAGRYKRIASSYEPLSDEGRATLQAQVDAIYEVFVDAVAEGRGVDVQTVLADMADGRIFIGRQAIDAGLADGVLSWDALMASLASGEYAVRRGLPQVTAGVPVSVQLNVQEDTMPEGTKQITLDVVKAEHPAIAEALRAEGRQEGATAERERIRGIETVALKGFESIVEAAKFDGKSTAGDVAAGIIAAQKADQSKALARIHAEAPEPAPAAPAPEPKPEASDPSKIAPGGFIAAGADTAALDVAARRYQAANPGVSYADALNIITKGH